MAPIGGPGHHAYIPYEVLAKIATDVAILNLGSLPATSPSRAGYSYTPGTIVAGLNSRVPRDLSAEDLRVTMISHTKH
jgi:hypothetical protein